jgi:hypothetical protein
MWKKAFIRLTFVLMLASMALLVVSASKTKVMTSPVEKCPNGQECCKSKNSQGDNTMFWESVSSTILGSIQF